MNQKELKELIDFLVERDIAEFELERGDVKVRIKRGTDASHATVTHHVSAMTPVAASIPVIHAPVPASAASAAPAHAPAAEKESEDLHTVKSPIVGTFYESPAPGAPPFIKSGDSVEIGQVLCIIEAMKLMNEIEADVSGEVVKRLVSNNQAVEYGQPLFTIRPAK
jgi:acetyl-CoA carboxylase biotin carboxyl carrier protein